MDAPTQWQPRRKGSGKRIFGMILAGAGILMLLHTFFPDLVRFNFFRLGWPWILVIIGLALGAGSRFRNPASWILLLIGGTHIVMPQLFPEIPTRRIIWPGLLVGFGLMMIFGRHDRKGWKHRHCRDGVQTNDSDTVAIDVTFGGRKEVVTSRSFRGGVIRASFAGVELNLAGAEGSSPMNMDIYANCASVEIVVPSHWQIQNEIHPMAGSVEDNRTIRTSEATTERPLLILRGSCNFGSVELKSY